MRCTWYTQAVVEMPTDKSRGMSGSMLLGSGEVCPPSLPAPFSLGDDIINNQVSRVDPPVHVARLSRCCTACWFGALPDACQADNAFSSSHISDHQVQEAVLDHEGALTGGLAHVSGVRHQATWAIRDKPVSTANRCVLQVLCVNYRLPPEQPHLSKVMEDTVLEPPILTELDMPQV